MEHARDIATEQHKNHWANNGGSPRPDDFFPGFEEGWRLACEALANGTEFPDVEKLGKGDDVWEWKHGFVRGAQEAKLAGEGGEEHHEEQPQEGGEE